MVERVLADITAAKIENYAAAAAGKRMAATA